MARKATKKKSTKTTATRKRRTAEERIADLQEEIARLEAKKRARELAQSQAMKGTLAAIKQLDKALGLAEEEGDSPLRHALVDARAPIAAHLEGRGLALPKVRKPRGRRPRSAS